MSTASSFDPNRSNSVTNSLDERKSESSHKSSNLAFFFCSTASDVVPNGEAQVPLVVKT